MKSEFQKLIGEDELEIAIEKMLSFFGMDSNESDELIQLKGRHKFLKKSIHQNVINFYEANLELCKIRASLIGITKEIPALFNDDKQVDNQHKKEIAIIPKAKVGLRANEDEFEGEDYGYLDYLIDYEKNCAEATNSFQNMAAHTKLVIKNMAKRTEQLNRLNKGNQNPNLIVGRNITNSLANEMLEYVSRMDTEIGVFERASKDSLDNAFNVLRIIYEDGNLKIEEVEKFDESLDILIEEILNMRESSVSAKSGFSNWSKVTKEINRARRRTEDMLDQLYDELTQYIDSLKSLKDNIKYTLIEIENKKEKLLDNKA